MHVRATALGIVATLLAAGCLAPQQDAPLGEGEPVPFRTLARQRSQEMLEGPFEGALDEAAWRAAWERLASGRTPAPPRPYVDPEGQRVLAVATLPAGNGCHDVRIRAVERVEGVLVVRYDELDAKGPDATCPAQMVWPAHLVAVDDTTSPVRFERALVREAAWGGEELAEVERLAPRELAAGAFSGVRRDLRELLRDEAAWEALWREHAAEEPAPAVDFAQESVVAVVVHGPTGCAGMHLGEIAHDAAAGVMQVEVVLEAADPRVRCLVAFEDVYAFVAVPRRDGVARFALVEEPPSATGEPAEQAEGAYAFRTLAHGATSGIDVARREVVRDEATWRARWAEHGAPFSPAPEVPEVDFGRESVLLVTLGDRPDTCWRVEVTGIVERAEDVEVTLRAPRPPPGMACGQMATQPHHFVTFPLAAKHVVFVEEDGP